MIMCDRHPGKAARTNSTTGVSLRIDGAPPDSCWWCAVDTLRLKYHSLVPGFCHYRACRRAPEPNGYCLLHGGLVKQADVQAATARRPIKELRTHVEHAAKAYKERKGW